MDRYGFNDGWKFNTSWTGDMAKKEYDDNFWENIRLPHTTKLLPYNNFSPDLYQMTCGYRKTFYADKGWYGKKVFLNFQGIAHKAIIYVNGKEVCTHLCGYTAIQVEISKELNYEQENTVAIMVDSHENLNIPPFGFVIDYMTYGGIYREAYIEVANTCYIKDAFCTTRDIDKDVKVLDVELELNGKEANTISCNLMVHGEKNAVLSKNFSISSEKEKISIEVPGAKLWDIDNPNLYDAELDLKRDGEFLDRKLITVGFRSAEFRKDGFYLNGKYLKLRGLNRHQAYPYVGYAMPGKAQADDVNILKEKLGVNAVRTSHYPQSQIFIDKCDEAGLLVFTEFPGWQHIGDEQWKKQALVNLEEMIVQYRNHPSIIIWGVRINESQDDDELYKKTNELAHRLDGSRATGGVRNFKKSNLLEDVYTYNDFVHTGNNQGVDSKKDISSDINKPYLVSEYNGHMYPTKSFDCEAHRLEQAKRHANVLESVASYKDICGSFGWCMFDYNTHKDFGSGDEICYHGVLDMFRNPKMAAYVYSSQQDKTPVLHVSASMDIGEHPGGNVGDIFVFTNADSVKLYKNNSFISETFASETEYKNMVHGPILIKDLIGDTMEKGEGFSHEKSESIKKVLYGFSKYGMNMPLSVKATAGKLMLFEKMTFEEATRLYGKYLANWGGEALEYKFEAIKDGKVVATVKRSPGTQVKLSAETDRKCLTEDECYDVACVKIEAKDDFGNISPYYQEPVKLRTEGELQLLGPDVISLKGGMGGTYVKTKGNSGNGRLIITDINGTESVIDFLIMKNNVKKI